MFFTLQCDACFPNVLVIQDLKLNVTGLVVFVSEGRLHDIDRICPVL